MPLLPMSDAERARYGGPKFATDGLHVAVVQGGYGAKAVLEFLQGQPGLDVQPLFQVAAQYLKDCRVLIMTQPYAPERFTAEVAVLLTTFVHAGGGLITTHNAVGFKGLPVLLPEVCAQGSGRVSDNAFKVLTDHPVAAGLPRDRALRESYYDYVTLQPGPGGTVVARGAASGEPVVVCGQAGKGRYVACGLGICISPANDRDCPPTPEEGALLVNAVRWAGGRQAQSD